MPVGSTQRRHGKPEGKKPDAMLAVRAFGWEGEEEERELQRPEPQGSPCPPRAGC